uniref:Uncharacterized protein n=1 Tax=viral metagenome TaxID=1070528 RepID=A0A6C0K1E3_9ZZZZ
MNSFLFFFKNLFYYSLIFKKMTAFHKNSL